MNETTTIYVVLIEGVLFRARYLGSTQLVTDGNPTKLIRMLQAQEAVSQIKVSLFSSLLSLSLLLLHTFSHFAFCF